MSELRSIIFLQYRFRFLLYLVKSYNNKINHIETLLYQVSSVILKNYSKEIINQFIYNKNLSKLDNVTNMLDTLPKKITIKYNPPTGE